MLNSPISPQQNPLASFSSPFSAAPDAEEANLAKAKAAIAKFTSLHGKELEAAVTKFHSDVAAIPELVFRLSDEDKQALVRGLKTITLDFTSAPKLKGKKAIELEDLL